MISNKILEELKVLSYRFKDYLISERKLASNTVSAYCNDIEQFLSFLNLNNDFSDFSDVFEVSILDDFLIWLYQKGLDAKSIVRKLSSLSIFLKFLKIENVIKENPAYLLNRPKTSKKIPNYLTVDEVETFINYFDSGKPEGIRDRALFELVYSCGLRVSEVSALNVGSVYFEETILQVFGKGSKERYVPMGQVALNEMKKYLKSGRPLLEKKNKRIRRSFFEFQGRKTLKKRHLEESENSRRNGRD